MEPQKWYWRQFGSHVRVRVFQNGAKCGELCFRVAEWNWFAGASLALAEDKSEVNHGGTGIHFIPDTLMTEPEFSDAH